MTQRLFIALLLPDQLKSDLDHLMVDARRIGSGIKWVDPANLHLTLKFLGETQNERVSLIDDVLYSTVGHIERLEVSLAKWGGFPNLANPRVIWAGLNGAENAVSLAGSIDDKLGRLGFETDHRPFRTHLTLGRVKSPGDYSRLTAHLENFDFLDYAKNKYILDQVGLVRSTLTPKGPIYENLKLYDLK